MRPQFRFFLCFSFCAKITQVWFENSRLGGSSNVEIYACFFLKKFHTILYGENFIEESSWAIFGLSRLNRNVRTHARYAFRTSTTVNLITVKFEWRVIGEWQFIKNWYCKNWWFMEQIFKRIVHNLWKDWAAALNGFSFRAHLISLQRSLKSHRLLLLVNSDPVKWSYQI